MRKLLSKLLKSNDVKNISIDKRVYGILNDRKFIDNIGRATDILYDYDKRK